MSEAADASFVVPKYIGLKNHPNYNERWLHKLLIDNPLLLGLGNLEVRDSERRQPSGGRLDLLLQDVDNKIRYEVEIQLGAIDESHIIRTIEYWDIERRRYPQYDHIAVIVAEDVTSRFLNVISLLNGAIPLIAIRLTCATVNGALTLLATRVVDVTTWGTEDEDSGGSEVGRGWWEKKSTEEAMKVFDSLVKLVNEVEPKVGPKFNKSYIGLADGTGAVRNFVSFRPQKKRVFTEFKIPQDEQLTATLEEIGLETNTYDSRYGCYRIYIYADDIDNRQDKLRDLVSKARDANAAP